jgi:hypothetical protein
VLPPPGVTGSPQPSRRAMPVAAGARSSSSGLPLPPPPAAAAPAASTPAVASGKHAMALYNFSGDPSKGQIDLAKNSSVIVHVEHAAGWSTVECNGKTGFVPSSYVKISE